MYLWPTVRLVAPSKRTQRTAILDVRLVGIAEARLVACAPLVLDARSERLAARLWQQQVAIGVNSGIRLLAFGLRAGLEFGAVIRAVEEHFDREVENLSL